MPSNFINKLTRLKPIFLVQTKFGSSMFEYRANELFANILSPPSLATSSTFCPTLSSALSMSFWCFNTKGLITLWYSVLDPFQDTGAIHQQRNISYKNIKTLNYNLQMSMHDKLHFAGKVSCLSQYRFSFFPKRQPASTAVMLFTRDFQREESNKIESFGFKQIFDRVRSSTGANG